MSGLAKTAVMQTLAAFSLIADIGSTTLVILLTIPAIRTLLEYALRRFHGTDRYFCEFYVDQDGEADRVSIAASKKKFERMFIMIAVVSGGITASARTIVPATIFSFNIWAQLVHWILQLTQSTALAIENSPTARFSLGWKQALSVSVTVASVAWELLARYKTGLLDDIHSYTMGAEIGVAILIVIISLSLPRRPDVYRHGTVVDRELTTSFLGRVTFSWASFLIQRVSRKSNVDIDHLPELDFDTRAENLQGSFAQSHAQASCYGKGRTSLWKVLVFSNRRHLLYQLALSVPASFLAFGPHLSLLQILRILERRSGVGDLTADLWFWVLALGICTSLSAWLEAWIGWIASNKLAIRVYEQLSAVMFNKALHSTASSQNDLKGNGKEDRAQGTQVAVNLVAVDVPRIAGIATFLYSFLLAPMKLGVACGLLQHVLGWKSLLAGMTTLALLMLLNHACMTRYTRAGKDLMACRDRKIVALTEALRGVRQIKFSAAEDRWEEQLGQLRDAELLAQATSFRWNVICFSLWVLAPILLSVASLSVYAVSHGELTASVAFTAVSALTSIEIALSTLPELITNATDALISIKRIGDFLDTAERKSAIILSPTIRFDNATVAWAYSASISEMPSGTPFVLRDLTVQFPEHELSLVCGRTGAGKSLLLAAILDECKILDGIVKRPSIVSSRSMHKLPSPGQDWIIDSAMAYVAQTPWIEAATVRQNILFGTPFNGERYRKVLFACALIRDLQILEDGDLTEVGPNGVNLSGGQKARISLARALYSRAGIIIMDDIFSSVDVHTAQHLYEHALTGELATRRTRILVTHHVRLCLPRVDYLAYLDNGNLVFAGSLTQMRHSSALDELLGGQFDVDNTAAAYEGPESGFQDQLAYSKERCRGFPANPRLAEQSSVSKRPRNFVEEEALEKGAIPLSVFRGYIQKCGGWRAWAVLALCFATYTGMALGKGWWLCLWSEQRSSLLASSGVSPELQFYLGVYIALSIIVWIVGSLRSYLTLTASLQASRCLFSQVLHAVFRAPLRWLDTVPLGRILNRFTADFNMIDSRLGFDVTLLLGEGMQALGAVIAGILVSPVIIVFSAIVAWVCGWYARQYLGAARQLKRLESISRSPIYELLASSLSGLWTIRSYQRVDSFVDRMHGLIDRHARVYWNLCLLNHWLNFRINISGALFATAAAITFTLLQDLKASSAGFAIGFIIQLSAALAMAIRMYVMFDLDMNCVERVLEYSDIKSERYDGQDAPAAWPSKGRLEVANLSVGYAPDHPLVLRGVSFEVEPNERIGIVGRTGAGKSSLALALFRFLEAREGRILIDGVDISQIKLHHLRRPMGIIPQDPTLFAGTIRSNLDPFQEHDDGDLLAALDRVQWLAHDGSRPSTDKETAAKEPACPSSPDILQEKTHGSSLDTRVAEGGSNLSQGQRQLLCLARAMLCAPKILVLDEATSAVDTATDKVIQRSIRSDFGQGSTTMLVIAHRISTVADFDRILVLDAGKVVEFASPRVLMQLKNGIFRRMVEEDGESEHLKRVIFATPDR